MNIKKISIYFLWLFVLIFVVSAIVTLLYSFIAHGKGIIDWGTTVRLSVILSIVLTLMNFIKNKN